MQVQIDPRDNNTVYTGSQFGYYYRIDRATGKRAFITPQHELGERPYRWNWETPIHLSVHNPDILYMGAERLFRSMDKGDHFKAISGDLTAGGRPGDVASGTLVALHESPLRFGLIYTGSDDGLVHMTPDGGVTWNRINDGLPQDFWISSLQASTHAEGRVFAALNGYRWDHFASHVFMSDDYGKTWVRIATGLPAEPVNIVREDPVNPDLLYIGTDNGLYISLDRGRTVMTIGDMPNAPVHDLVVHPRDRELVVATHGRSLYKADVHDLQDLTPKRMDTLSFLTEKVKITYRDNWGSRSSVWQPVRQPDVTVPLFSPMAGPITIDVLSGADRIQTHRFDVQKGFNYPKINLQADPSVAEKSVLLFRKGDDGNYYFRPGVYELILRKNGQEARCRFEVADPEKQQ
jgi:photosystem II stability/assembly factor-like uncharacterized protein